MIKIRTKLTSFFLLLVAFLFGIGFFVYHTSQQTLGEYNHVLQRFFLINQISQETNATFQSVNSFLIEKSPKYLDDYQSNRSQLAELQSKVKPVMENKDNHLIIENYYNMISSFLNACDATVGGFQQGKIDVYTNNLTEASQISRFIQDTTLTILNNELTHYRDFYHYLSLKNTYLKTMAIFVFASLLLLSILYAFWFSDGITRPIRSLSGAAKKISKGHFDGEDIQVTSNDELRLLTEAFNQMRHNIQGLIKEIKEQSELDRLLKEMELNMLQSQMNPHFLFNALNTITKTAYLEGAEKTSDLMLSMSNLLRHRLRRLDKPSTIEEEVSIVNEYIFIQKARFGDHVSFSSFINKECLSIVIPGLTIQPIVENAFIHGLEVNEEGGELSLIIDRYHDYVRIDVIDNGVGMTEHLQKRLLDEEHNEISSSIGLRNVRKRLQLYYQIDNVMTISSQEGKGTKVSLFIPVS